MKNRLTLAVLISTYNHRQSLFNCLNSLKNQTYKLDHIIVVETIKDDSIINAQFLSVFFDKKVKITYKKLSEGSEFLSRNIAMQYVKEDIILFIDDDVIVDNNYIKYLLFLYQKYPNEQSFVGRIIPLKQEYWQIFINRLFTAGIKNLNSNQIAKTWPTLNFSIKTRFLKTIHIKFNENYTAMGDLDFCLRLNKLGCLIRYNPNFFVIHKYKNNVFDFFSTFSKYYENVLLLDSENPDAHLFDLKIFTNDSKYKILYYVKLIRRVIIESNVLRKRLLLPYQFYFACFIFHFALFIGIKHARLNKICY
jgi:GT2 family glycosyltransferase